MVVFSLTFVRHGETDHNRKSIIQGQTDTELSSVGEKQAVLVAERLQNERFTHIFSSDLSRAHKTAKLISDGNKVCRHEIILDKRLRERKFGTAEGKSSKELLLAAKKAKKRYIDYTPAGAESVAQVQERVENFFEDLCKLCKSYVEEEETVYTPAKIKRRHGGSLGRNSRHSKRLQIVGRSQSFCGSGNIRNIINEMNLVSDYDDDDSGTDLNDNLNFCGSGSFLSMQVSDTSETEVKVIADYQYRECFASSSDDSNLSTDVKLQSNYKTRSRSLNSEMDSDKSPSSREQNSSESDSTISDSVNYTVPYSERCEILADSVQYTPLLKATSPSMLNKEYNVSCYGCPNVSLSLSPSGQPFSSISSISSGRNCSFDEVDGLPMTAADVLVVSHGGFIKECVRHFVEKLGCKIPGMKGHALKVCPNCSISKFTITLDETLDNPSITCITIHDKDHLAGLEMSEAKGAY